MNNAPSGPIVMECFYHSSVTVATRETPNVTRSKLIYTDFYINVE